MGNNVGAVFDAVAVSRLARAGISGMTVWHAMDNIYGLIDYEGNRRSPAYLFRWGPAHLSGEIVRAESSDPAALEVLAVRGLDGRRSLLLMVKAGRRVRLDDGVLAAAMRSASFDVEKIDSDGWGWMEGVPRPGGRDVFRGYSVVLVTDRAAENEKK